MSNTLPNKLEHFGLFRAMYNISAALLPCWFWQAIFISESRTVAIELKPPLVETLKNIKVPH